MSQGQFEAKLETMQAKLKEIKVNQVSQDQFEAKLDEMKSSQGQKLDAIKGQFKNELDCVIHEMENLLIPLSNLLEE